MLIYSSDGNLVYHIINNVEVNWITSAIMNSGIRMYVSLVCLFFWTFGEIMCKVGVGTSVGHLDKPAWILLIWVMSFLDIWSAMVLFFPGKCSATTLMSKWATKNHMHRSRCITTASLHNPLLMAVTTLRLSLFTKTSLRASWCPQTAIANTMGTSSFSFIYPLPVPL